MMEEGVSPPPPRAAVQNGYSRLTALEIENPAVVNHHLTEIDINTRREHLIQYFHEMQQQIEAACQEIDWNRVYTTAFLTLSIVLIMSAFFFPFWKSQIITQHLLKNEFILNSLTISEFKASPSQVTGRCDVVLNISNHGDRSMYHENSVLSIFLDHELLWVTRTSGFFLESGTGIMFNVSMNTTTISVPASFVPTALLESQKLRKPLHFKLKYDGMLREGIHAWHEERSHVYLICGWIKMMFVRDNVLMGGPAGCSYENM